MTREEWAVLVKAMKAVYTSPSFLPDQYAFDTWYGLLKDLDYKLLSFGLKKYILPNLLNLTPTIFFKLLPPIY